MGLPGSDNRGALFRHRPGLDGFRGLAVAAVLAFHGGFSWATGGYLGVSAFFTLSGFLIATLLLRERDVTGGIGLRSFWVRRARRLLPAGLIGLMLAVAYSALWAESTQGLRADVLACLGYVANWRFVFSERSYADLFAHPSPVQHYWSLAVEEQFYIVFPLLVVGCALVARRRFRVAFASVVVALSLGSIAVSMALAGSSAGTDRVYYGTDARAVEILAGVLAAIVVSETSARARPGVAPRWITAAGGVGLAVMVATWATVDQGDGRLHPWLLLLHAVAAVAVINAAVRGGPIAEALSWPPLRWLGRVSYGIYVYHWPVFLALSPGRTGWSPVPLFALRVAVTLVAAAASYRWIERPILAGTLTSRTRRRPVVVGVAAVAVVVAAVFAVPSGRSTAIDFESAAAALEEAQASPPALDDDTAAAPLPIAVLGDSMALMSSLGIDQWGQASGEIAVVANATPLGCPLIQEGMYEGYGMQRPPEGCDWRVSWPAALASADVDVAVAHLGVWDIVERTVPGHDGTFQIGELELDEYLSRQLDAANELLLGDVDTVIWLTLPEPASFANAHDATSDERVARFNQLLRQSAARADGRVQIVDMAAWVAMNGPEDPELRPDGVHFGDESALVAGRWLGPAIVYAVAHPAVVEVGPDDVPTP